MLRLKLQYFGHLMQRDPDAGKDCRQEEKGIAEDETVGWHHQFNGHELEQAPGDSKGQESLVCYSSWGLKELDTTESLNSNDSETHSTQFPVIFTNFQRFFYCQIIHYELTAIDLEKGMAMQSSILVWRIPGTGDPGGLSSMGLHRVGHN